MSAVEMHAYPRPDHAETTYKPLAIGEQPPPTFVAIDIDQVKGRMTAIPKVDSETKIAAGGLDPAEILERDPSSWSASDIGDGLNPRDVIGKAFEIDFRRESGVETDVGVRFALRAKGVDRGEQRCPVAIEENHDQREARAE